MEDIFFCKCQYIFDYEERFIGQMFFVFFVFFVGFLGFFFFFFLGGGGGGGGLA